MNEEGLVSHYIVSSLTDKTSKQQHLSKTPRPQLIMVKTSKQGKHQAPPVLLPARPPTREEEEEAAEGDHNGGDEFAEGP